MSWNQIANSADWSEIKNASEQSPQVIFKHSTRCSISSMVLSRFELSSLFKQNRLTCWYLDLIQHRDISNLVAEQTGVEHQSPQCIVIHKGNVIYAESHGAIDANTIELIAF